MRPRRLRASRRRLHAAEAEAVDISRWRWPHVLLDQREIDGNGIEVIPTPGHSPGSVCYLAPGVDGRRYLFTGDTVYRSAEDSWTAGFIPGISDWDLLRDSLEVLATLEPDLVVSSAFAGDSGVHEIAADRWADCVAEARSTMVA